MLVAPGAAFSTADVYAGMLKGLRANGVHAEQFPLDDCVNFYSAAHVPDGPGFRPAFPYEAALRHAADQVLIPCMQWRPDAVVVYSGTLVHDEVLETLRFNNLRTVLWCTESPYEDESQLRRAALVDTVILNDPTNLERFQAVNARSFYIPQSHDHDIHRPPGRRFREAPFDFGFVGTGFPSRRTFLEAVNWDGINAGLAGFWRGLLPNSPLHPLLVHPPEQCIDNADTAAFYRSCRMSANLSRREADHPGLVDGWAMGPREVELAATGCFFAREARGEGDELLWMLPTFKEPGELEDLIRWWTHPARAEERTHLAQLASAAVADRTFTNHAAQLLRLISS